MKTAIYIEDGVVQLVVTPESEFEKNALSGFRDKPLEAKLFVGQFYDCRGGWVRQKDYFTNRFSWDENREEQSLILTTKAAKPEANQGGQE